MALHLSCCLRQPLASRAPPAIRTRQPAKPSSRRIARSAIRSKRRATAPLAKAPPLREVYLKYPIEQLEEGFAEGMGSRHRDMPQIQFSTEQVVAILKAASPASTHRSGRAFPQVGKRRPRQLFGEASKA